MSGDQGVVIYSSEAECFYSCRFSIYGFTIYDSRLMLSDDLNHLNKHFSEITLLS